MAHGARATAMLMAVSSVAGCPGAVAGGPGMSLPGDAGRVGMGLGEAGVTMWALAPDADGLSAGVGVGVSSYASFALISCLDLGGRVVREADTDRWSGMAEASVGFGGPRWPVALLGGFGFALPLWDTGALDLDPTLLLYAELWAPVGDDGEGGTVAGLTLRRTWYSRDATLAGSPVDLDGWSLMFALHF